MKLSNKPKKHKFNVVYITWRDHCSVDMGWSSIHQVVEQMNNIPVMESSGFLVGETKYAYCLSTNKSEDAFGPLMNILKADVIKIKKLKI